jgi:quercetin dioxygenase-like cupin family protein
MNSPRPAATGRTCIDDARSRVTEWRFAPGAETGWHRHELDYVIVPMTSGRLLVEDANGSQHAQLGFGQPYARSAGVEHNVVNANDFELVFIEIELKACTAAIRSSS